MEDGVVESETEADWVSYGQVLLGDLLSLLVSKGSILGSLFLTVTIAELCDVPLVVALHLLIEDIGLASCLLVDKGLIQ